MPCRWQCSTSFFSRRGLVWATNQRSADTRRIIQEKFHDVNPKLRVCVVAGASARDHRSAELRFCPAHAWNRFTPVRRSALRFWRCFQAGMSGVFCPVVIRWCERSRAPGFHPKTGDSLANRRTDFVFDPPMVCLWLPSKKCLMAAVNRAWLGAAISETTAIRRPSSRAAWRSALELDGTTAQLQ